MISMEKLRILFIITRLNIGGPAMQVIDLTRELTKRGHSVQVVTGFVPEHEGIILQNKAMYDTPEYIAKNVYPLSMYPQLKRGVNIKLDWFMFKRLREEIKRFKPTVVHTHMAKAGFLGRLAALTVRPRPKLVHTFHGHTFHSYFSKPKSWFFLQLERWLGKHTDTIITLSKEQWKDIVVKYKVGTKDKVVIIPFGLNLNPFLKIPEFRYDRTKWLTVGIIGRLTQIKNHELFFEFVTALRQVFDRPVCSYVIGDGERRKELEGSNSDSAFFGWIPLEAMPEMYKFLDIICCTSKNEGTPVTLVEAMAAGRLVVSTPVGGVVDLIGKSGFSEDSLWLFDGRGIYLDPSQVKRAAEITRRILEGGEYKNIVKRAREYVKREHSLGKLVDNVEKLYVELMEDVG